MHKISEILNNTVGTRPLLSSALAGWEGILLEEYHLAAYNLGEYETPNFRLTLQLSGALPIEFRQGDQLYKTCVSPGSICFTPRGVRHGVSWQEYREILHITLAPSLVTEVLSDYLVRPQANFIIQKGIKDEQVFHLGLALRSELQAGNPSGPLYADLISRALIAHLATRYAANTTATQLHQGGLTRRTLRQITDYFQSYLAEPITLRQLAELVQLNPYHLARAFKQSTGLTPHQYLADLRLERAKYLLLQTDQPIAEIALQVGYSGQNHFSAFFRKHTFMTPGTFRKLQ